MSKFIILCGGTGGHLAPGIAVGQSLIKEGHFVTFAISKKQVDSRLVKKYPTLHIIKSPGVAFSKNPLKLLSFLKELFKSVKLGRKLLKKDGYDAVISFGGFNSLGISIAAALEKVPLILHEANRKAGKATKFLGRFAKRIYVPYGVKILRRQAGQVKYSGYPIRDEIKPISPIDAKKVCNLKNDSNILLILGGSQGAEALNNWAYKNFEKIANEGIDILCVCGMGKINHKNKTFEDKDGIVRELVFMEFCDDMASVLSAAEVVVARAGAGTIAELARCKVPSAIVPYPFAADNHQLENAKCYEKQGGCVVVEQRNLNKLFFEVLELFKNAKLRENMKKNMDRVDDLNDTTKLATDIIMIANREQV